MDNFKLKLREKGRGGVDWIGLAKDWNQRRALVNVVMNLWFHIMLETIQWLQSWWPLK
jgi:hypothetical protein